MNRTAHIRTAARGLAGLAAGATVLTSLLAGGSVASAAEPAAAPAAPAAAQGAERCHTSELQGRIETHDGDGYRVYAGLVVTNVGDRTCYMKGFPGVSYVAGDAGTQVGKPADLVGPQGEAFPIAPGQRASAELSIVPAETQDPATCKPVDARGFRVYPPGETAALFVPFGMPACSGTVDTPTGSQLGVKPFILR
ncbi:DUF4232 domain-containing protein [Pseudonocardia phyllosphaerae]|uniref:DUF4232 domain-containing protein n=1 Tax=Pseudonocardia phyllosphaerae TaxID=3390502 RepID=UPI00397C8E53